MTPEELDLILAQFGRINALVVGDFCLDRWCTYDPDLASPSRETGIARTAVVGYEVTAGAGGTVANNLVDLGSGRVEIVGVAGDDSNGFELERALRRRGISAERLIRDPLRQTFTYTKFLNRKTGKEDLSRVDFVNTSPPGPDVEAAMVEAIATAVPAADVVLVADQSEIASGAVITDRVREALLDATRRFPEKIFVADSRSQVEKFPGLIVKPNEDEAVAAARRLHATPGALRSGWPPEEVNPTVESAGEMLRRHLGGKQPLYITRGAEGALLFTGDDPRLVLACRNDNPVDICGAGDAFEAGLALTLAATQRLYGSPDYAAAAVVGHLVAAVTITKKGTGTASPEELREIVQGPKSKVQSPKSKAGG